MNKLFAKKYIAFTFKYAFALSCIAYVAACFTPYVNAIYFFPLTFLALIFPLLLMVMIAWLFIYLLIDVKKSFFILLLILIGYKNIASNIGFNKNNKALSSNQHKIKLLSWNVRDYVGNDSFLNLRKPSLAFFNYIKMQDADVVCLQDADNWTNTSDTTVKDFLTVNANNYPYKYFSIDNDTTYSNYVKEDYGTCILSKYPITFSNHITYSGKFFTESLAFANVNINGKTIRIYNTHLRSMYIKISKEQKLSDFRYVVEDTNLVLHSNAFAKIKHYDTAHISQALLIKKVLDTTSIPFVFCADLNSTPSSYVYHTIAKNLNDTYLKTNWGLQATYLSKLPFLRIDVVLTSKELQPISYSSPRYRLSDHCPIITEIAIPN